MAFVSFLILRLLYRLLYLVIVLVPAILFVMIVGHPLPALEFQLLSPSLSSWRWKIIVSSFVFNACFIHLKVYLMLKANPMIIYNGRGFNEVQDEVIIDTTTFRYISLVSIFLMLF